MRHVSVARAQCEIIDQKNFRLINCLLLNIYATNTTKLFRQLDLGASMQIGQANYNSAPASQLNVLLNNVADMLDNDISELLRAIHSKIWLVQAHDNNNQKMNNLPQQLVNVISETAITSHDQNQQLQEKLSRDKSKGKTLGFPSITSYFSLWKKLFFFDLITNVARVGGSFFLYAFVPHIYSLLAPAIVG